MENGIHLYLETGFEDLWSGNADAMYKTQS